MVAIVIVAFYAAAAGLWWVRHRPLSHLNAQAAAAYGSAPVATAARPPDAVAAPEPHPSAAVAASPPPSAAASQTEIDGAVTELRRRDVFPPIDGMDVERLKGSFTERRSDERPHEAVDIPAPRNTPIHAVENGSIAKLFVSAAGGNTIYQYDSTKRFCYYYAHLERYAPGLHDGQPVQRGEVIGYVGTSGNAPADTPHLHFAVFELGSDQRWWVGRALDPYAILRR